MFSSKLVRSVTVATLVFLVGVGLPAKAGISRPGSPSSAVRNAEDVASNTTPPGGAGSPIGSISDRPDRVCKIGPRLDLPPLPASKTRAKTTFALDLLTKVAGEGKVDTAVSPFGVSAVLATLDLGAEAKTKAAIARTLAFARKERVGAIESLRREARLLARIGEAADAPLSSADLLLVDLQIELAPGIADTALAETGIALRPVDFSSKDSADAIDRWAAWRTRGRIPSIMNPGDHPQLAAIDAFAFKDCWRYAFDPAETAPRSFFRLDGTSVDRPMMNRRDTDLAYGATGRFYAVELPYADDRFALTLIAARDPKTPPSGFGTREVRDILGGRRLKATLVDLILPKFTSMDSRDLTGTLESLGLPRGSSLDGFARGLKLSEMRQKTFVAADEVGTEAAAITVGLASRSMPIPSKATRVTFDHPFLYALKHRQTGAILMIGWVADPATERVGPSAR